MRSTLAIIAACALTCAPSRPRIRSIPPPSHSLTVTQSPVLIRVAIDHATLDRSLDVRIASAFAALRTAGYVFALTHDGEPYDIRVTRRDVPACHGVFIGYWDSGTRTVSIAPRCLDTHARFRHVIAHEMGHVIGLSHICRYPSEVMERRRLGDDCHGRLFGPALMNPFSEYAGETSPSELTHLDLEELRRVGALNNPR